MVLLVLDLVAQAKWLAPFEKVSQMLEKNLIRVPITNGTLPHEIISEFKSAKVLLKPASPGTGIIAGHATRAILEFAGVRDALTKCLSSRNVKNIAEATMRGLKDLKDVNEVARLRDLSVEELLKKR